MNRIGSIALALCTLAGPVAGSGSGFWVIDGVSTSTGVVAIAYGTDSASAYRGDWGAGVSNLAANARQLGDAIPFKDVSGNPWYTGTDEWGYGFKGLMTSNSVWTHGSHYSIGGYRTSGHLRVGDDGLTGLSTYSMGILWPNRLSLSTPGPLQFGSAHIAVAGYDLIKLQIDGSYDTMTEMEDPRMIIHGGLQVDGNMKAGTAFGTNVISGDTQIGNSERRLDINQNGLFIMDAVTEDISFAVEQYSPSQWRVDLKGNPLINAGPVAASGVITSAVDVVAGTASLTNAVQRSGDTMGGTLDMATHGISGQRFGIDAGTDASGTGWYAAGREAGMNAGGNYWHAFGNYAGINSTGLLWHATGYFAGINAQGDFWHASGYGAGNGAIHTNSAAFGIQAGFNARGRNRVYLDAYPSLPMYADGGATNDAVVIDNGYLYLGRGPGNPFGGELGGTLRGNWQASGNINAAAITLGGETRTQWNAQSDNGPAFFFGNGDYLYADGTNLFYVSEAGVTNQVAFGGGPGAP